MTKGLSAFRWPALDRQQMTKFPSFSSFLAFPGRVRALRFLLAAAAVTAFVVPEAADAARARGWAYDGIWTTVFATTRGNCSSGYSVPFTVTGARVSSAGG